ncbi:hypothetical protein BD779DRAFT_1519293 [Infundibulicybe gibba]|nr:hypothetical protein BD779DRAFT_1519293 [Infundibulicybe gibba]
MGIYDTIPANEFYSLSTGVSPLASESDAPVAPQTPPLGKPDILTASSSISQPFTSQHLQRDEKVTAMYKEITRKVVGPMPVTEFISEFLPEPIADTPWSDAASPKAFEAVRNASSEVQMYPLWIKATAPFCPDLELVDTHAEGAESFDGKEIRPDITARVKGGGKRKNDKQAPKNDIVSAEIMMEFEYADTDDPFTDDNVGSVEHNSKAARDTLGQITLYATAHLAAQFRTHIFSLLVFKNHSRLLRWDRSGVIVTERFALVDRHTADFFWRYNHASRAARGYDEYAKDLLPNDEAGFHARSKLQLVYRTSKPLVALTLHNESDIYIIERSTYLHLSSPTGRSTRSFLAYCVETDAIVWLKDTWRIISPAYTAEHLIYQKLHKHNVPYVSPCKEGGDLGVGEMGFGRHQTITHVYQRKSWARPLPRPLRTLRHYRLVLQDVGRDCTRFHTVKQFVKVIRDASVAHDRAYFDARVLHRDISVGNILILGTGEETRGMLIDWDLSKDLDAADGGITTPAEHTGTWQFMAARLQLPSPNGAPLIVNREDDLESFLYVMIWVALRYTDHDLSMLILTDKLTYIFEQRLSVTSGIGKTKILGGRNITKEVKFKNKGMVEILAALSKLFAVRYGELTAPESPSDDPEDHAIWETLMARSIEERRSRLERDGGFTERLELALAAGGWEPHHAPVMHNLAP